MSSDSEYMEQMRKDRPANEVGLIFLKYEENIKKEKVTSYDAEMGVKTEINEEKDGIDIDKHQLSYEQLHSIKTEEAVCKRDYSTNCYVLLRRLHPDYEQHINDMVTIKVETNEEKEDISDVEIPENDLSYEQLKPDKSEDYKIEYDNEYMERRAYRCCVSLNKLDYDHGQDVNDIETIKGDQNVEKAYTSESADVFQCFNKTQIKKTIIEHCRMQFNRKAEWHQCHLCNFKTKYKRYLRLHHTSKHDRLKHDDAAEIFHCNLCNYKTKRKDSLLQHHRLKHDDEAEIFHCNLCDYETKRKNSLVQHHRSKHDDVTEIFDCYLCDYRSKSKYNLLRHYKSIHDDTAEIFYCELCNFKTKYKSNLKHHRSKHNEKRRKNVL